MASTSQQTPLLHPPTKKTDEVDFSTPFRAYIATTYQEDPDKYVQEIATLHRLRQDTRGAGKDVTGRDILYRYYGQLELLDLRFPVDEKNVKVLFTWYDAFSSKSISQYSIAYEKACIIFNIASTCAAIAVLQNRFEPAGTKMAFNYLQASAGLFSYINENFLHAPSLDMSRDSVKSLVDLMLAQAQEVFIEKVLAEKKKGALVAKLAAQAAHGYTQAGDGLGNESLKGQFDKNWIEIVKIKAKHFEALSHYHKSLQSETDAKYGESVSHITKAEALAKEANKLANSFAGTLSFMNTISNAAVAVAPSGSQSTSAVLLELTKNSLAVITERKNAVVKDNDIIYHDSVPSIESLPPIEKLSAAKPITFAEVCTNGAADIPKIIGPDIFAKLVPLSVHEAASVYSEEQAKILRAEQASVESANGDLQATLDSMNLIPTLDKLKKMVKSGPGGGLAVTNDDTLYLPSEVKGWCEAIRGQENQRGTSTDEVLGMLEGMKVKIRESLDEIGLMLDKEQHECENMRVKYIDRWPQEPSAKLTSQIRHDIRQHRESFEKAMSTDHSLVARLNECRRDVSLLCRPLDEVESIFAEKLMAAAPAPKKDSNVGNLLDAETTTPEDGFGILNEQVLLEKMDNVLNRLKSLKAERTQVLTDLKAKIHEDDISSNLLLNKNKESQVFQSELSKFKSFQTKIANNVQMHTQLLADLSADFNKLKQTSQGFRLLEMRERRRADLIKEWRRSFELWKESKEGLRKGVQFYTDLTDLVQSLRNTVVGYVNRRNDERSALVKRLEEETAAKGQRVLMEEMARLSVSTQPSPMQNQPPPPHAPSPSSSTAAYVPSPTASAPPSQYSQSGPPAATPQYGNMPPPPPNGPAPPSTYAPQQPVRTGSVSGPPPSQPPAPVYGGAPAPPPSSAPVYGGAPIPHSQQQGYGSAAPPPNNPVYGGAPSFQQQPPPPTSQTVYGGAPPQSQQPPQSQPVYGGTPAPPPSQQPQSQPTYGGMPPPSAAPYGYSQPPSSAPRPPAPQGPLSGQYSGPPQQPQQQQQQQPQPVYGAPPLQAYNAPPAQGQGSYYSTPNQPQQYQRPPANYGQQPPPPQAAAPQQRPPAPQNYGPPPPGAPFGGYGAPAPSQGGYQQQPQQQQGAPQPPIPPKVPASPYSVQPQPGYGSTYSRPPPPQQQQQQPSSGYYGPPTTNNPYQPGPPQTQSLPRTATIPPYNPTPPVLPPQPPQPHQPGYHAPPPTQGGYAQQQPPPPQQQQQRPPAPYGGYPQQQQQQPGQPYGASPSQQQQQQPAQWTPPAAPHGQNYGYAPQPGYSLAQPPQQQQQQQQPQGYGGYAPQQPQQPTYGGAPLAQGQPGQGGYGYHPQTGAPLQPTQWKSNLMD
ncbi:bck1-like resistance to osmotic shock [Chytridiales sp. JEL 0842]|nr:bck1-like resistance to osmotic shock [Chytridiales sp. JEL 0842]